MARIAFSVGAFDAIARTLPLGSGAVEPYYIERGERTVWLEHTMDDRLGAMRRPGGEVILRLVETTAFDDEGSRLSA
jgi:hypothetical protein